MGRLASSNASFGNPAGAKADSVAAHELALYTLNTGNLYTQQAQPIIRNLAKKIKAGKYDPSKALILWGHLAERGAREYGREYGSTVGDWKMLFPPVTRKLAAKELAEHYEEELRDTVAKG